MMDDLARLSDALDVDHALDDLTMMLVERIIADIDERIGTQLDVILHHPRFRALEAAWLGLHHVVNRTRFDQNVRISVWSRSKEWMIEDLSDSPDVTHCQLYQKVHAGEYGQFGGEPYSAVFANFEIGPSPEDMVLLRGMAAVAAMAHAPVMLAASPKMLQLATFRDLPDMREPGAVFEAETFERWRAFRESDNSRFIGLVLPRILMRAPHTMTRRSTESFIYRENVTDAEEYLWGNPIFALAVRLGESFARYRTSLDMLNVFYDPPPALDWSPTLGREYLRPPVECLLSNRLEGELDRLGFIPVTCDPHRGLIRFAFASSAQVPKAFSAKEGGAEATLNYLVGTLLPYVLFAARWSHYLKVMERESIGRKRTSAEMSKELNEWLSRYTTNMDHASEADRRKRPLRRANVTVADEATEETYRVNVELEPHLKFNDAQFKLSMGRREKRELA